MRMQSNFLASHTVFALCPSFYYWVFTDRDVQPLRSGGLAHIGFAVDYIIAGELCMLDNNADKLTIRW